MTTELLNPEEESYDTSEPDAVNTARKKSGRKRADRLKFVEAAMGLEEGRAWFYDLLIFCQVFNDGFDEDPIRMAFKAGRRNLGLKVLDDVQTAAPHQYLNMVQENKTKNG